MTKIKRFKINKHLKDTARRINAALGTVNNPLPETDKLDGFLTSLINLSEPAVIYDTLDGEFAALGQMSGLHTVAAITLGAKLQEKINSLETEPLKNAAAICALELLDSAFDFTENLIKEQSQKENMQIAVAKLFYIPSYANKIENNNAKPRFTRKNEIIPAEESASILPQILNKLDISKIEVSYCDTGIFPLYSMVFASPWTAKKHRK